MCSGQLWCFILTGQLRKQLRDFVCLSRGVSHCQSLHCPSQFKEHFTKCFLILILFNPNNNPMWYYCLRFINEETEAHRG